MQRALALVTAGILCLPASIGAGQDQQADPPVFRSGIELIQLDVSVLDRDRHPVRGLTAGDFTVLVDGQPRPIAAFKAVELPPPGPPPSAPWIRDVAPDVVTNTREGGRVVVIILDDGSFGQVGAMEAGGVQKAREVARAAVDELGPDDLAAVVFTENNHTAQNFTSDRRRLLAAIDTSAMFAGGNPQDALGDERGSCQCGLCSIEALGRIAESLRAIPQQRKTAILISAGVVVWPDIREHCNAKRQLAMATAFRQAHLSNLTINAVDPKGLIVGDLGGPSTARVQFLRTIAETTGGRAVVHNNDMERQVPVLFEESSSYYLLGVEAPAVKADGRLHPIRVQVNRPDVDVRTRTGYYTPTERERRTAAAMASPGLGTAIAAALPKSDIPLDVTIAPLVGADRRPALAIVLAVAQPNDARRTARTESIKTVASAFDPETGRRERSHEQTLSVSWNPTDRASARYEVLSWLPVRPGRYEVRVGVETGDGRTGSVYGYAEVPDFADDDFSVSGLMLSATPSPRMAIGRAFTDLAPLPPTARRVFLPTDRVTAFLRVYQSDSTFTPTRVTTRLTDTQNVVVAETNEPLEGRPGQHLSTADHEIELPIADLAPGEYLLTIEVSSRGNAAQRAARFRVE